LTAAAKRYKVLQIQKQGLAMKHSFFTTMGSGMGMTTQIETESFAYHS
jgi:hypothetical protein